MRGWAPTRTGVRGRLGPQPLWVVAGGDQQCGCGVLPNAAKADQGGCVVGDERAKSRLELDLLRVDHRDAASQLTQHVAGVTHDRVVVIAVLEAAGTVKLCGIAAAPHRLADRFGSREQQRSELVQRTGAVLLRRLVQDLQHAHCLDHAVTGFGRPRRGAGQHRAGCGLGVDRVGLAAQPARLAVGTVDLDHLDAVSAQVTSQSGSVGAGALDADLVDLAVATHPRQQLGVALRGRSGRRGAHHMAGGGVDHHRDVNVGVGVHPARDVTDGFCHAHQVGSSALIQSGEHRAGREADKTAKGLIAAGSYEVTPPVGAGAGNPCERRPTVQPQDTETVGRTQGQTRYKGHQPGILPSPLGDA